MGNYVLLSKLTATGRKTIKSKPQRVAEVNKEVESLGAKVKAQYAVLGPYDFVTILEASDPKTVARISVELSSRGTVEIMSMPALEVQEFLQGLSIKKK